MVKLFRRVCGVVDGFLREHPDLAKVVPALITAMGAVVVAVIAVVT